MEDIRSSNREELIKFLRKLEARYGFPHDYKVLWIQLDGPLTHPVLGTKCQAFINKNIITIQTTSLAEAKDVLAHEFIEEILLQEFTEPYNDLIGQLIGHFQNQTYKRRERLVNRLVRTVIKELAENGE